MGLVDLLTNKNGLQQHDSIENNLKFVLSTSEVKTVPTKTRIPQLHSGISLVIHNLDLKLVRFSLLILIPSLDKELSQDTEIEKITPR